jgi:hypothetical protein
MRKFRSQEPGEYFSPDEIALQKIYAAIDKNKQICILISEDYHGAKNEHSFLILEDTTYATSYPPSQTRQGAIFAFHNQQGCVYEFETLIEFLNWALNHEKERQDAS